MVIDQTLLYSQDNKTDNVTDTLAATVPIVHEVIPETPFARHNDSEEETTTPWKRGMKTAISICIYKLSYEVLVFLLAVDVKSDPFKRLSKGNTLDYGLKTLDESTCSRY